MSNQANSTKALTTTTTAITLALIGIFCILLYSCAVKASTTTIESLITFAMASTVTNGETKVVVAPSDPKTDSSYHTITLLVKGQYIYVSLPRDQRVQATDGIIFFE